jgi:hypothetical protein
MRLSTSILSVLLLISAIARAAIPDITGFHVAGGSSEGWPNILRSLGLRERPAAEARVFVLPAKGSGAPQEWLSRLEGGAVLIIEGASPLATKLGFRAGSRRVRLQAVREERHPEIRIEWQRSVVAPVFEAPDEAQVFCRARPGGQPLVAGIRRGRGAVLWVAVPPGEQGYERFPFLPNALVELGVRPPFASRRLWAFFDAAYRLRDDPDSLARRWRDGGIAALHVGAWQYFESDPDGDEYLRKLIASCHRHNILVYAWLALPHVSDRFWHDHPAWREKTVQLKDAYVPWRRLMNLANPECHRAVAQGVREMVMRFDWDGVNLAELYFDGVQGVRNVKEFTPMNADVRREFKLLEGFDPLELFTRRRRDPKKLRAFLDYRVDLAARLQENWLAELERLRQEKPGLDLVLTYVDDRFEPGMRDAIGADSARALKTLDRYPVTFIVEDPYTVWDLGPQRYPEIARRYRPLTPHWDRVGVDINVVERGQHVHPTRMQAGSELLQLIRASSESFSQVMFYYEFSILPDDFPLLPAAAAVVDRCERRGETLLIESPYGVGVHWEGPASLDGRLWPVRDRDHLWAPPGKHVIEPAATAPRASLVDFNGVLEAATSLPEGIEVQYTARSRALATFDRKPARVVLDGQEGQLELLGQSGSGYVVRLPQGRHTAVVVLE